MSKKKYVILRGEGTFLAAAGHDDSPDWTHDLENAMLLTKADAKWYAQEWTGRGLVTCAALTVKQAERANGLARQVAGQCVSLK